MQLLLQLFTTRPEDVLYQLVQPLAQAILSSSDCVRASNASAAPAFTLRRAAHNEMHEPKPQMGSHDEPDGVSTSKQHSGQYFVDVVHLALDHEPVRGGGCKPTRMVQNQ